MLQSQREVNNLLERCIAAREVEREKERPLVWVWFVACPLPSRHKRYQQAEAAPIQPSPHETKRAEPIPPSRRLRQP